MLRHRGPRASAFVVLAVTALASSSASAEELGPPPPMSAPSGTPAWEPGTDTTRRLDEAEREDSGRNFELFWLDAAAGGAYIDMSQFSSESFQIKESSSFGPAFDVGAGVRFVLLSLGARLRYNALSAFNMWQINGEAGIKIPVSSLDVRVGAHGGYSFVGRLDDAGVATSTSTPASGDAVSIRGFNAGLDAGVDYFLTPLFSVGVGVLGDFLFLKRPPVDLPATFASLPPEQQAAVKSDPLYKNSGTSAGLQVAGGLRLGLHLGL